MVKVGVVGFGTMGQRVADDIIVQKDMELIGVSDNSYTLAVRSLKERGMPYAFFGSSHENVEMFADKDIPTSGTIADLVREADIIVDMSSPGVGEQNRVLYERGKKHAIFQSGEDELVSQCYFHSYINYEKGRGKQFLQLPQPSLVGMLRVVDVVDRAVRIERLTATVMHRNASPGSHTQGLMNSMEIDATTHLHANKTMQFIPHIQAMSTLIYIPTSYGHLISLHMSTTKPMTEEQFGDLLKDDKRIRVGKTEQGFHGDASLFNYANNLSALRNDLHEVFVWEDSIQCMGNDVFFSIGMLPEGIIIPECIDAIRASCALQKNNTTAILRTNEYLELV